MNTTTDILAATDALVAAETAALRVENARLYQYLTVALPYLVGIADKLEIARNAPEVVFLNRQILEIRATLGKRNALKGG